MRRTIGLIAAAAILTVGLAAVDNPTPTPISGGRFEASGVVIVPNSNGVLFVDDGRGRDVFWMEVGPDGRQRGPAVAVPLEGTQITDPEGITSDGSHFYVVGSQSKSTGYDGDGLARFVFDPASRRVDRIERIQGLKRWLATHVAELHGTADRIGETVLNIEAVAWEQRSQRLLLGLRAPVVDGQALVVPIRFRDQQRAFTIENLEVVDGKAIRLPLDGAGIRSLEFDSGTQAFHLIAGSGVGRENRDFRLLQWDGDARAPRITELTRFPSRLKPEGIALGTLGGQRARVVVFDTGRFALLR